MQDITERKELTAILHIGPSNYQNFRRVMEVSPAIYQQDLSVYTDDVDERHDRNMAELRKIKNLIKEGKLTPQMLSNNTYNTYYASYVLDHHFRVFMKVVRDCSKSKNPVVQNIAEKGQKLDYVGAFFDVNEQMNFKTCRQSQQLPKIDSKGLVTMSYQNYFYAKNTSVLISHCAFVAQTQKGQAICFVRLRNEEGLWIDKIKIKDFGATISSDYHNIGYNFNGASVQAVVQISKQLTKSLLFLNNDSLLQEFKYSLNDLKRSLHLTIKYTHMRRQFATLEGTKEERRIITYQAVASRILDGYSTLCAFSFLTLRLQMIPQLAIFFTPLLQYSHHTLLQRVIHLRQCCGGFGYLQYSGHPASIQRIAYRASCKQQTDIPDNKQFMKRAHYYSGDDNLESFFMDKVDIDKIFNFGELWRIFILICIQMRKRKTQLSQTDYTREFLKQAAIQAMFNFDSMGRIKVDDISLLLQYQVVSYILQNGKFINWTYLKMEPQKFYESLQDLKRNLTGQLSKKLLMFCDVLEIDNVRNAIVGRQDSDEFYKEVMEAARTNKRNSKQFLDYVKEPIVQMINQNRGSQAKL